jgi:hypothetical protein
MSSQVLIIAAVVVLIIVKRFAGEPVGSRTLVLPAIMVIYGISQIHGRLNATDIALLAVELVVALAAGLARGYTIKLFVKDGHLWQRYTLVTLGVWLAMIALRVGFAIGAGALGATITAGATVLVTFGLSMVVETLVVGQRASATGHPIRPAQDRRDRQDRRSVRVR